MSCPFKHLWASDGAHGAKKGTPTSDQDESKSHALPGPPASKPQHGSASGDAPSASEAPKCPFGFGARQPDAPAAPAPAAPSAEPATCPLGFGSASGPKMSAMHCIICKSLLYDAVETNCSHTFCRGCIQGARDCPSCGADVTALTPQPEAQAAVEAFIDAAAAHTSLWALEGTDTQGPEAATGAAGSGKAGFLLQVALRAMAAGNLASATHRLLQCMDELNIQLQAASESDSSALKTQLGAVTGCLGDCARAEGRFEEAIERYEDSVGILREAVGVSGGSGSGSGSGADSEAAQSLGVTLNKIGEMRHVQGDVEAALGWYEQALELRRERWAVVGRPAASDGSGGAVEHERAFEAALDAAVSEAKVADALESLGRGKEAVEHVKAAQELIGERWVIEAGAAAPVPLRRKLEALKAHLGGI